MDLNMRCHIWHCWFKGLVKPRYSWGHWPYYTAGLWAPNWALFALVPGPSAQITSPKAFQAYLQCSWIGIADCLLDAMAKASERAMYKGSATTSSILAIQYKRTVWRGPSRPDLLNAEILIIKRHRLFDQNDGTLTAQHHFNCSFFTLSPCLYNFHIKISQ